MLGLVTATVQFLLACDIWHYISAISFIDQLSEH